MPRAGRKTLPRRPADILHDTARRAARRVTKAQSANRLPGIALPFPTRRPVFVHAEVNLLSFSHVRSPFDSSLREPASIDSNSLSNRSAHLGIAAGGISVTRRRGRLRLHRKCLRRARRRRAVARLTHEAPELGIRHRMLIAHERHHMLLVWRRFLRIEGIAAHHEGTRWHLDHVRRKQPGRTRPTARGIATATRARCVWHAHAGGGKVDPREAMTWLDRRSHTLALLSGGRTVTTRGREHHQMRMMAGCRQRIVRIQWRCCRRRTLPGNRTWFRFGTVE